MANDQSTFLGEFGLAYATSTLVLLIIDWGSVVVLARILLRGGGSYSVSAQTAFWSLSIFRLLIAFVCIAISLFIALETDSKFAVGYALAVSPGLVCMAFNFGGILDGLEHSGLTGATSALPIAATAAGLPFSSTCPSPWNGALLGGLYAAGVFLMVLAQYVLVRKAGFRPGRINVTMAAMKQTAREGGNFLLMTLPGQLFFRGQIAISASTMGTAGVAHFLYAKQLINVVLQFLYFLRRTEFPMLVKRITTATRPLGTVLLAQKLTIGGSIAGGLSIAVLGILLQSYGHGALVESGRAVILLSPVVIASGFFSIMSQGFSAWGRMGIAGIISTTTMGLGLAICGTLTSLGIAGLAISEIVANLVAAFALVALMLMHSRSPPKPTR